MTDNSTDHTTEAAGVPGFCTGFLDLSVLLLAVLSSYPLCLPASCLSTGWSNRMG